MSGTEHRGNRSRSEFLASFGGYAQYVKGPMVQPLKDAGGANCVASGRQMAELIGSSAATASGERLLFFTNNKENQPFLEALGKDYTVPEQVAAAGALLSLRR